MKQAQNNRFQIIAGEYKSRRLNFPDYEGMRPTPGKVRETLFNWIQFEAAEKTYLDCFVGSGALSFEALSRGASKVVAVEKNHAAFLSLKQNIEILGSQKIQILNQNTFDFLQNKSATAFDFVFLDPPFGQNLISKTLPLLVAGNFVKIGTQIYLESEKIITKTEISKFFTQKINIIKQSQAGNVHFCLIQLS